MNERPALWQKRTMAALAGYPRAISRAIVASLLLTAVSCIQVRDVGNVGGPQGPTDLLVVASTPTPVGFEGIGSVVLFAQASGGTPPYSFRWTQNSGLPVELDGESSENPTIIGPLAVGRYTFRALATDAAGFRASGFVTVEVIPVVAPIVPDFTITGQATMLKAGLSDDLRDAVLLWEVIQGTATLDDPASTTPNLTTLIGETVHLRLTVSLPGGAPDQVAERTFSVVSVSDLHPAVTIETNLGPFVIELDGELTPRHMVNFLLYVDEGFYDGLLIHRNACTPNAGSEDCVPFVIQGGGYRRVNGDLELVQPTRDPINKENENSPSNTTLYSVALALSGGDANSGTTQFFINLNPDNSFLDAQGFTVFGSVSNGREVIDAIVAMHRVESPIIAGEVSLPEEDVVMVRVTRLMQ